MRLGQIHKVHSCCREAGAAEQHPARRPLRGVSAVASPFAQCGMLRAPSGSSARSPRAPALRRRLCTIAFPGAGQGEREVSSELGAG